MMLRTAVDFFEHYVLVFVLVLSVVVFVHEFGHYWVARINGVRIEAFSIGFGPEITGWVDRHGTRWRIAALPLGGYVKMFGDADAASTPDQARISTMTDEEKAVSFPHKRLGQRAAIIFAGPAANFLFAILAWTILLMAYGLEIIPPVVGTVNPDSAAASAGLRPGDRIVRVDGTAIDRFQDLQRMIRLGVGDPVALELVRDGGTLTLNVTPRIVEMTDLFGNVQKVPLLGIGVPEGSSEIVRLGPFQAVGEALRGTETMVSSTFIGLGQIITGRRGSDELGGPLRIAKDVGQAATLGFRAVVMFGVLLSINLGLINLFPVPLLDGGHLMFYFAEAILGRPLGPKAQEYGFRIGFFLVFALMIFVTGNDLVNLKVWEALKSLLS